MKYAKSVEEYLEKSGENRPMLESLRSIALSTDLEEKVKWGLPVYTWKNKNIAGLGAFKSYVGLWFFQGALLLDEKNVLVNAQKGKTKAMRQWRFHSKEEIDSNKDLIIKYIREATNNQKAGREIKPERKPLPKSPEILARAFELDPELEDHFKALSLSQRREYLEYLIEAKRDETKKRRLQKIVPMVKKGKGLNDAYK